MRGAIHPVPQYAFTARCLVKKNTGTTSFQNLLRVTVKFPENLPYQDSRTPAGDSSFWLHDTKGKQ